MKGEERKKSLLATADAENWVPGGERWRVHGCTCYLSGDRLRRDRDRECPFHGDPALAQPLPGQESVQSAMNMVRAVLFGDSSILSGAIKDEPTRLLVAEKLNRLDAAIDRSASTTTELREELARKQDTLDSVLQSENAALVQAESYREALREAGDDLSDLSALLPDGSQALALCNRALAKLDGAAPDKPVSSPKGKR